MKKSFYFFLIFIFTISLSLSAQKINKVKFFEEESVVCGIGIVVPTGIIGVDMTVVIPIDEDVNGVDGKDAIFIDVTLEFPIIEGTFCEFER